MNRRRRVAFVSHSMRLYGASRSLLALLEGFRAARIDVCVILPGRGPMLSAVEARGFEHVLVPFPTWVAHTSDSPDPDVRRAAEARAVPEIVEFVRRFRPDVVWSNASLFSVGALAAAALDLPHIWHLREVNGEDQPFRFIDGSNRAAALLRTARARIAVSEAVKTAYEADRSGPCEVIYSGIGSAAELATRRAVAWKGGRARIVLPGRLHGEKGQVAAIEAVHELVSAGRDVELRILGDGEMGPCEEAIDRFGLREIVTLAGFVLDLDAEYRGAHVALSCSRVEAMGRTTTEAMSYGLPVVGCASMGTPELVEHGVTGLLCDGSASGFAAAVERLIERPDEARRMGERARAETQRRFADEICIRATMGVLDRVCAEPVRLADQGGAACRAGVPGPTSER